jgi:HEAT repeat protein
MNRLIALGLLALAVTTSHPKPEEPPTNQEISDLVRRAYARLHDVNADVRAKSFAALDAIAMEISGGMFNVLKPALIDPDVRVRAHAVATMQSLAVCPRNLAPLLIVALQDPDKKVRAEAAKGLNQLGAVNKDVIPALVRALKDDELSVRRVAAGAIGNCARLGYRAEVKIAVPALIEMLKDKRPGRDEYGDDVRVYAALALGEIGPDARPSLPVLLDIVKGNEDRNVQTYAIYPLGKIGAEPDTVLPLLLGILKDRNRTYLHGTVVPAIGAFGAKARGCVPELIRALDTSYFPDRGQVRMSMQIAVIEALGNIGPDARDAMPEIEKILQGTNQPSVRYAVTGALQKIRGD